VIATVILVVIEIAVIWAIVARRPTRDDRFGPVQTIITHRPADARPAPGRDARGRNRTSDEPELIVEYEELQSADAADDLDEPDSDLELTGGRRLRARIPVGTLDQLVIGSGQCAADGRRRLDTLLNQKIIAVDQFCRLTETQKQKLQLAGRGDIKRFIDRVESLRPTFQQVHLIADEDDARKVSTWAGTLAWDANTLRSTLSLGLFEDGSLFAKTLRSSVAADQFAAYDAAKPRKPGAGR
jgi:hypothetical protein